MKRSLFLIIGLTIILILVGFWVYSFLYGTPKAAGELFTDFKFWGGAETDFPTEVIPLITEEPRVDVATAKLRQLTTRPVIGFYESFSTSTEPRYITYAEAGTGHIYSINMTTGEETRLSNLTIPEAQQAEFSPNGEFAAIRSGYNNQNEIILIDLRDPSTITSEKLTESMADFTFSANNNLLFATETGLGTVGYNLNPVTKAVTRLFTVPFLAANISWAKETSQPHYVYPKASAQLMGYLYRVSGDSLKRLPIAGSGLIALPGPDYILYTELVGTEPRSFSYNLNTQESADSPAITIPKKCDFSNKKSEIIYCGYTITDYGYTFPDDWYKGTRRLADSLWRIDLKYQSATQLINPVNVVGREIDIINLSIGAEDKMLYFLNKNDATLWVYEI